MTFKRFYCALFLFIIILVGIFLQPEEHRQPSANAAQSGQEAKERTILLLPLDSRPPCLQFVKQLAEIGGFRIISPPEAMLARNKTAADQQQLRAWLRQNAAQADAAIISVDALIHGGLVPSRQGLGKIEDGYSVIELLQTVKKENRNLKLYAFSIIPRLIIADNEATLSFQKDMIQYSVLSDQISIFANELDQERREKLADKIPEDLIRKYLRLYEENQSVNKLLLELVENEVLSGLVIGQDDGFRFGIANEKKEELRQKIMRSAKLKDRVIVTRGTDEVALTQLGAICSREFAYRPKIHIVYSDESVKRMTMPFMPHSIKTTVEEKLAIAGGIAVEESDDAAYILFVHAGRPDFPDYDLAAGKLTAFLRAGKNVAMVDLSETFKTQETLLPYLLRLDAPINKLIAYGGWNTTSNSIGTVVTEANLMLFNINSEAAFAENQSFILARMIDDTYYQKQEYPLLNKKLRDKGIDPISLSEQDAFEISAWLKKWSRRKGRLLMKNWDLLPRQDLVFNAAIPWNRTFEIRLEIDGLTPR